MVVGPAMLRLVELMVLSRMMYIGLLLMPCVIVPMLVPS